MYLLAKGWPCKCFTLILHLGRSLDRDDGVSVSVKCSRMASIHNELIEGQLRWKEGSGAELKRLKLGRKIFVTIEIKSVGVELNTKLSKFIHITLGKNWAFIWRLL